MPATVTTTDGITLPVPLLCPAIPGQKILIPAGTVTVYRGNRKLLGRAQTVIVASAFDGFLDERDGVLHTVLPQITWVGSGGYWVDCNLTRAVYAANDFVSTVNEASVHAWRHDLVRAGA